MLLITCPVCGMEADETEFRAGGEAHIRRPMTHEAGDVSNDAQRYYLYMRANPRGIARELWCCAHGCGKWFNAVRDTVTLEFLAVYRIGETPPDAETGPESGRGPPK